MASRKSIPLERQLTIFYRDRWLCQWCHRPVVFAPAFRLIEQLVRASDLRQPVSYFHPNWRRDAAPLLDQLGAVIDHKNAHSHGGADDVSNLLTACNKCNARKNDSDSAKFILANPSRPVRGRYGEPLHWDGLASVFLTLANSGAKLTPSERRWASALHVHLHRDAQSTAEAPPTVVKKVPKPDPHSASAIQEVARAMADATPGQLGLIMDGLNLERIALILSIAHSMVQAKTGNADSKAIDPVRTTLATADLDSSAVWRLALLLETWPCTASVGQHIRSRHPFSQAARGERQPKGQ